MSCFSLVLNHGYIDHVLKGSDFKKTLETLGRTVQFIGQGLSEDYSQRNLLAMF